MYRRSNQLLVRYQAFTALLIMLRHVNSGQTSRVLLDIIKLSLFQEMRDA
jgi:hypothetical protein